MKTTLLYSLLTTIFVVNNPQMAANAKDHAQHKGGIIKRMDKNGDGVVTKREFLNNAARRFEKMDKNNDGKITKGEAKKHRGKMKKHLKDKRDAHRSDKKIHDKRRKLHRDHH